jgi:hypothetical protein
MGWEEGKDRVEEDVAGAVAGIAVATWVAYRGDEEGAQRLSGGHIEKLMIIGFRVRLGT